MNETNTPLSPNLFDYATKELSQDAFLCWSLAWADKEYKDSNKELHGYGKAFLTYLIKLHNDRVNSLQNISNEPFQQKINLPLQNGYSIKVCKQDDKVDVVVKIKANNNNFDILIEDKVSGGENNNQMTRYQEKWKAKVEAGEIDRFICIYYKSRKEAYTNWINDKNYAYVGPDEMLGFMKKHSKGIKDSIFCDYYNMLYLQDKEMKSFSTKPVKDWGDLQRDGFFIELQKKLDPNGKKGAGWGYVPTPRGGFRAFYWEWIKELHLYVQLEKNYVFYKMYTNNLREKNIDRHKLKDHYLSILVGKETKYFKIIRKSRLRLGNKENTTASIATIQIKDPSSVDIDLKDWDRGNYFVLNKNGCVDLNKTSEILSEVAKILEDNKEELSMNKGDLNSK